MHSLLFTLSAGYSKINLFSVIQTHGVTPSIAHQCRNDRDIIEPDYNPHWHNVKSKNKTMIKLNQIKQLHCGSASINQSVMWYVVNRQNP